MPNVSRKKGRKNRKHGRNKLYCKLYKDTNRLAKNKAIRQARHLKRYGPPKGGS